jgi:hypothetical protein
MTAKAATECAPVAACVECTTERLPVTDLLRSEFPGGKSVSPCGHGGDPLDRSPEHQRG